MFTSSQRLVRFFKSALIILFLLFCSFAVIGILKKKGREYNSKYVSSDCKEMYNFYGNDYI
jgi:hypothetical protein